MDMYGKVLYFYSNYYLKVGTQNLYMPAWTKI